LKDYGEDEMGILREGPIRRRLRERRLTTKKSLGQSPEVQKTRAYWASLIADEEKAEVEYRLLADMMAPGGPLEVATWVREMIWSIANDEKRHAQQLRDMLDRLAREGKIV
jgi:hypothetical protein